MGPDNHRPLFVDWTSVASPGTPPSAGDLNAMANNDKIFTVGWGVRALCIDNTLVNDNGWHAVQFGTPQYDANVDGNFFASFATASIDTFTIPVDGRYLVMGKQRLACTNSGYVQLRAMLNGSTPLDQDTVPIVVGIEQTARVVTPHNLHAGDTIQFQHLANTGAMVNLFNTSPAPYLSLEYLGRNYT